MLKKTIIAATLMATLAACQSTAPTSEPKNEIDDMACYFPDAPSEVAPKWICGITPSTLEISATGYAKKSVAGLTVMRDKSLADARVNLGTQFEVSVKSLVKTAITSETKTSSGTGSSATENKTTTETTAVGASQEQVTDEVTEYFEKITKNISSTTLTNSRVIATKTSPGGGLFTLVGMDKSTYDDNLNKIVNKAGDKNSDLWGKFSNKKSEDQLTKVLENLKK